jgi:DNA-binding GntR family transcriptional regulator
MPTPSTTSKHSRSLLRDDVYLSLRDAIVDGTFEPGERLRDQELEAWLGVSRTPIREALQRLAQAGLVVAQPGRATIVTHVEASAVRNAQQIAASLHELATRLAVPNLSDADIRALERANSTFEVALAKNDVDLALESDDAFHRLFIDVSGNTMVGHLLEQVAPLIRRAERRRFSSLAGRDSVEQHRAIIERSKAGDADGAAMLSRENWMTLSRELAENTD